MFINNEEYYNNIVRNNIKKYRKEKGYTIIKLSKETNISKYYLSELENNKRKKNITIATLGKIADALETDIKHFFNQEKN